MENLEINTAIYSPAQELESPVLPITPGVDIESVGLTHEALLPPGYAYAVKVTAEDAAELLKGDLPGNEQLTTAGLVDDLAERTRTGTNIILIGVNELASGKLVGMGALEYNQYNGFLSGLVVNGDHRGAGIGKAIVDERVQMADRLGIGTVHAMDVRGTNDLVTHGKDHYKDLGFRYSEDDRRYVRYLPKSAE